MTTKLRFCGGRAGSPGQSAVVDVGVDVEIVAGVPPQVEEPVASQAVEDLVRCKEEGSVGWLGKAWSTIQRKLWRVSLGALDAVCRWRDHVV